MKSKRHHSKRFHLVTTLLLAMILVTGSVAYAQDIEPVPGTPDDPPAPVIVETPATDAPSEDLTEAAATEPTADPTEAPTEVVTDSPGETPDVTATPEPDIEITEEVVINETPTPEETAAATETPTIEPAPTEKAEESTPEEATEEATAEVESTEEASDVAIDLALQTFCEMQIGDAGDSNPFSFEFAAINDSNIASFSWNLGDGTTATNQNTAHTYITTGSFAITLVCTPADGSPDITLTGSISISSTPVADFLLTPGTILTGLPPFNISTVNMSTGGALTYAWEVTDNLNTVLFTSSSENISYSFNSYGIFWFRLTVTDGAGITASAAQSVAFNAPPPNATFSLTPTDGTSPLNVTVEGLDVGGGPISSWSWDFGDGSPTVTGQGPHNHTFTLANPLVPQSFFITLSYAGPGGSGTVAREVGVYPASEPVNAVFSWQLNGSVPGGTEVCFTNESTGPVATSEWDFDGDGTYDLNSNDAVVCHVYASEGVRLVRLRVRNADSTATSTASDLVNVMGAPVASFIVIPGNNITWGTLIDLDSSASTGAITSYSWDFNGDGVEDSSAANPTGISLTSLGSNPIRLTVTGPGGSSFVEVIVFVARLEITCDFTGNLDILPTAGAQLYQSVIGNLNGRGITYNWTVTGTSPALPLTFTTEDITVNWNLIGAGSFVVTLEAVTNDGSDCTTSKTVIRNWSALDCQISSNLPSPLFADGSNYTFTANVLNLDGRPVVSYAWFVDAANQGVNAATFNRSWPGSTITPLTEVIRYEVVVNNGDGTTSSCFEEVSVTVQPWPDVTCSISSNIPNPLYPDNNTYTFTANLGQLYGRTIVSYEWYVDGVPQGVNSSTFTRSWVDSTSTPLTELVRFSVVVENGNGTQAGCAAGTGIRSVTVQSWPTLTCAISGNNNPIPAMPDNPNRAYTYSMNVTGLAGRAVTYNWTITTNPIIRWQTNHQIRVTWPVGDASLAPGTVQSMNATATITNPDGTTDDCTVIDTVNVQIPRLVCNAPIGDLNPVINETNIYLHSVQNVYGRNLSLLWELEESDGAGGWLPVTTATTNDFNYTFLVPGQQYRLRYAATADYVIDDCTSPWQDIGVNNSGVNFFCDAFPGGPNPATSGGSYSYQVDMDNGNLLNLHYTWVLVGPGVNERILGTSTSPQNGVFSGPAFAGALFGPIGNYTLRVDVRAVNNTNPANPGYSDYECSMQRALVVGSLNVTFSYVDNVGGSIDNSAVAVGRQICATNNSDTSHPPGDINQLNYDWTISGSPANNSLGIASHAGQQLPGCISFSQPGSYTIQLNGANNDQGDASFRRSGSYSVTFTVYGLQSILINRSNQVFAPATMNFSAVGVNITSGYSWQFINLATNTVVATRTGANVNVFFNNPGNYRAVVSGSGPLGITTAQADFTLLDTNALRAAFTPSLYGGVAPLTVCFTDNSVGTNIQAWTWEFGNGDTLSYDNNNIPASICTTFTTPGTTYTVRLTISNGVLTETATNTIRTYSLLESSATFSITPSGSARYCYNALLTGDISVTGWDLGDGTTGPAQNTICHTYGASGTYVVRMHIRNNTTGETGTVIRTVTVGTTNGQTPNLAVSGSCSADRTATFTVTNSGGDMTTPDQIVIRNNAGDIILIDTVMLNGGESASFVVANQSGSVTFSSVDFLLTASTTCEYPPDLHVSAACAGNLPAFTVRNDDGPMIAPQNYEIRSSNGTVVTSGSFQLARGAAPVTFSVPAGSDPYDTYTFVSTGAAGDLNLSHNCASRPTLSLSGICAANVAFTLTNSSGNDMVIAQNYSIVNGAGTTVDSGSFQLDAGESQTFTLTGEDPYAGYTFTSNGFAGDVNRSQNCQRPDLLISSTCSDPLVFTITNNGGDMLLAQNYSIEDGGGTAVLSGSLQLDNGESQTVTLTGLDPYASYTFITTGFAGDHTVAQNCGNPAFAVTSTCADPIEFTITNNGSDMLSTQNYTITNGNGDVVRSGSFQLDNGESLTITLTGLDPYAGYRLQSGGFAGSIDTTQNCQRPVFTAVGICADPAAFTITNNGGDMLSAQTFTVRDRDGNDVTPASNSFQLANGESVTISLTGLNPYGGYRLESGGFAGVLNERQPCEAPALEVTTSCDSPASFIVHNTGGDMLVDHTYRLTTTNGQDLTPADNTFLLLENETLTILTPSEADLTLGVTFSTDTLGITASASMSCAEFALLDSVDDLDAADGDGRFDGLGSGRLGVPNWNDVPVCGYNCPTFRLYHTDETGDWEVFRLDGANELERQSLRRNITFGVGEGVVDMSPSLSPNTEWVVFTSNRDGNWEIYVASAEGDPDSVQRVTFNEIALDTDPMWGPNNFVVYETTRHGNWDLYMVDMSTGQEYRLTDDEADDINAFWSPDGSKLIFQSNRAADGEERRWQIYELDLSTMATTHLSDGQNVDVDPQYSNNGGSIVFRTYRDDSSNSQIAIMDSAGQNTRVITQPEEDATNAVWSPSSRLIAYQSNRDGDLDVYIYDVGARETRKLTENAIADYAPTWLCSDDRVVFTSDIMGSPDIYEANATPIQDPAILVEEEADQMTFEDFLDIYPNNFPPEENASREGQTVLGAFGEQTTFLRPETNLTPTDLSIDGARREDWSEVNTCPAP